MISQKLSFLRLTVAAALLLALSGCSAVAGGLPSSIVNALGQVTGLSSNISQWQSSLGGMIDDAGLSQLAEYAGQAGSMGNTVTNLAGTASEAMSNPLKVIGDQLTGMSNINVDSLRNLAPQERASAVNGFGDSARGVGSLANNFLNQFGG